jgi:hypothetical protein
MIRGFFALVIAVTVTVPQVRAAGPELGVGGLSLIPGGSGFVTVRVAELLRKVGGFPVIDAVGKKLGVSLEDIERVTILIPAKEDEAPLVILAGTKPFIVRDVLAACVPDATEKQSGGLKYHCSGKNGNAVYFFTSKLMVAGHKDALASFLTRSLLKGKGGEQAVAVASATGHDVVVHVGAALGNDILDNFKLTNFGVEALTLTIDLASRVDVGLRLACTDEGQASKRALALRGMVQVLRAQLLMVIGMRDLGDLLKGDLPAELALVPWDLLRQAEAGLQQVTIRTTKSSVTATTSLRVAGKTLRAELEKVVPPEAVQALAGEMEFPAPNGARPGEVGAVAGGALGAGTGALVGRSPGAALVGGSLGAGAGLVEAAIAEQRAESRAPSVEDIVRMTQTNVNEDSIVAEIRKAGVVYNLSADNIIYLKQQGVSNGVLGALQHGANAPATPVAAPGLVKPEKTTPPEPARIKLTVANVCKEPALLFEMGEDGKMTFRQKVPAGEALEVTTTEAQRWVAIFPDNPAGESFVAKEAKTVWLLRPSPRPAGPATSTGAGTGTSYTPARSGESSPSNLNLPPAPTPGGTVPPLSTPGPSPFWSGPGYFR